MRGQCAAGGLVLLTRSRSQANLLSRGIPSLKQLPPSLLLGMELGAPFGRPWLNVGLLTIASSKITGAGAINRKTRD